MCVVRRVRLVRIAMAVLDRSTRTCMTLSTVERSGWNGTRQPSSAAGEPLGSASPARVARRTRMNCVAAFPRPREAVSRAAGSVDAPVFASLRGPYSITDLANTYSPQNALSVCVMRVVLRVAVRTRNGEGTTKQPRRPGAACAVRCRDRTDTRPSPGSAQRSGWSEEGGGGE
jgi:hypothetical protein